MIRCVDAELLAASLVGLLTPETRLLSCFAVMPTYFEARDPGVIMDSILVVPLVVTALRLVIVAVLVRVVGKPPLGVRRPDDAEGVILPLGSPGVTRPFDSGSDGVLRPFAVDEVDSDGVTRPEIEGVARLLRDEATEEGLEIEPEPTVGGESLDATMNTPQFGAQAKYRFLSGNVR